MLINKEVILTDLKQSTDSLLDLMAHFTVDTFNYKPSAEEWSAAQVAEHLLKVDVSSNKALQSETISTNRPPDQKIPLIKEAMSATTKRLALERVQPSGETFIPDELAKQLKAEREKMEKSIQSAALTEACVGYKHPALGTMTRLEWIYFNIHHAERHRRQMQRLLERVEA